jgi:DNA-binding MarR family transcriptional regulator
MPACYCDTLRLAARKATARYDAALAPVGVSVAQFGLLNKIAGTGKPSLTDLARLAGLDRSTVGRNVRVLERMGFVALTPGEDQREATVTVTDQGHDVMAAARPLWRQAQADTEALLGPDAASSLSRLAGAV